MKKILQLLYFKLMRFVTSFGGAGEIDYISDGEALPSPFTLEEETRQLDLMAQGDDSARCALIEHNLRLVVYIAKRFENTGIELEELISVGTIGLIKAVKSYKRDKKIKLATYASRCIENEILMYLRKTIKLKAEVSLDEPLNVDWEGNTLLLSDVLGTDGDVIYKDFESNAEKEMLWATFEQLNKREQQIVALRFGLKGQEEKTQKEIADMMGISQSYISRLEKKILNRMKKEIMKLE